MGNNIKTNLNKAAILIIIFLLLPAILFAQKKVITNKKIVSKEPSSSEQTYNKVTWQDGKEKRQLKILPDQIAEFSKTNAGNKAAFQKSYPGSKVVKESSSLRIWKVNDATLKSQLKDGKVPSSLKKNHSPVFKDQSGRKRALPGNVIVTMDKSWDSDKVQKWAEKNNLVIIRQLSSFSNTYVIETPPGIESLNISNSLNNETGVVRATPNWWTEVRTR